MLIIQDILISDDIVEKKFLCNLNACKGACCVEGDFGAPLEDEEIEVLEKIYPKIKPFLTEEGKSVIEQKGVKAYYEEPKEYGTPLIDGKACAFINFNSEGIAICGIEQAYNQGEINFKKPISCHLYPIRIEKNDSAGFEALNYDKWDICNPACSLGNEKQLPVYRFLKDAIIRKYGEDFYEELEAAVAYLDN